MSLTNSKIEGEFKNKRDLSGKITIKLHKKALKPQLRMGFLKEIFRLPHRTAKNDFFLKILKWLGKWNFQIISDQL